MSRVSVLCTDICQLTVDAVVNAANSALAGGGGVDGAIHRAAGPQLHAACRAIGHCDVGAAVTTAGFALPARWIIHTVGPVWRGGERGEASLLRECYRSVFAQARAQRCRSLAVPAISCGVYGYPPEQAVMIACDQVRAELSSCDLPEQVIFCCFDERMADLYRAQLGLNS